MSDIADSSSLIGEFQQAVELHRRAYAHMPCTRENIQDALVTSRCKLEEIEVVVNARLAHTVDPRRFAWEYMIERARISIDELSQIVDRPGVIDGQEVAHPLAILESVKICTYDIMPRD